MADLIKKLDFSVIENLQIPEIKDDSTTSNDIEEVDEIINQNTFKDIDEEEEEENTNEDIENEIVTPTNENETSEDPIHGIAQWSHEIGIIDFDEEDYNKVEDKEEYFKEQFNKKAKELGTEGLPDQIKELVKHYEEGVPLDELINVKSNIQRLENITDDVLNRDEDLQEYLLTEHLRSQDFDEDEIREKIELYKDKLLLDSEAKIALKKLLKNQVNYETSLIENSRKELEYKQKEYQTNLNNLKQTISDAESFIPGLAIKKENKEKFFNAMTKRDRTGMTELEKKMQSKEMQLAVAQFVLELDGKLDGVIERKAASTAALKIKNTINSDSKPNKSTLDITAAREALRSIKKKRY